MQKHKKNAKTLKKKHKMQKNNYTNSNELASYTSYYPKGLF